MTTPRFIILLAIIAALLGALAMLDNWAYHYLCEQRGINWLTTPDGKLAHRPYGALFVLVRSWWWRGKK